MTRVRRCFRARRGTPRRHPRRLASTSPYHRRPGPRPLPPLASPPAPTCWPTPRSRRLAPLGRGGVRRRPLPRGAGPAVGGVLRLPLVPRDGPRVLLRPRHRPADQRVVRGDQGGSRGTARHRPDLPGRGHRPDGPRRVAADRLPHPRGEPFFGGTYFPREARHGVPGFAGVLAAVHEAWEALPRRGRRCRLRPGPPPRLSPSAAGGPPGSESLVAVYRTLEASFDPVHGGFGGPPKFPQAASLEFLLRVAGARLGSPG